MQKTVDQLIEAMRRMPVIDTHEHLPPENDMVSRQADVFTRLYCHYSITIAITSGLKIQQMELHDTGVPLDERWRRFRPCLAAIRDTGYARAAQAAVRELYGIEDINDDTYVEISRRLQEGNTPGLYQRILGEKCGAKVVLNQSDWTHPLVRRNTTEFEEITHATAESLVAFYQRAAEEDGPIPDPETLVRCRLEHFSREKYAALKYHATISVEPVKDQDAASDFARLKDSSITDDEAERLGLWMAHKAMELAHEYKLVVAVHCGLVWCCWNDFRALNPLGIVPLLMRYRDTTFDLYHAGIPWVREMGVIGNQYPNVHLNLVWCHQISPYMTEHMLNEWIDLVPVNKITGFAGDNVDGPEKTVGVLALARENIARPLARRLRRGQISESRALEIARAWLYENPKRIYGL